MMLRLLIVSVSVAVFVVAGGCSGRDDISSHNFVGKWKSSRLATPLILHDNGDWEIKTEEGSVLQYGVWKYQKNSIVWSIKMDAQVTHDVNPVISVEPLIFRLKEADGSISTFTRLD